jgi:hypothetical protein
MGIKGVKIRLTNTDLIRRFGNVELEVDPRLARTYVEKGFAIYKQISNSVMNNVQVIEEVVVSQINFIYRNKIFPDFIIGQ